MNKTSQSTDRMSPVRLTLQLEGAAIAAVAILVYAAFGGGWGLFALLILAPDIFMLGYLVGKRTGAVFYNIAHSYLVPLALGAASYVSPWEPGVLVALIWIVHIGADRAIGYGLKYTTHFKDTHLGRV